MVAGLTNLFIVCLYLRLEVGITGLLPLPSSKPNFTALGESSSTPLLEGGHDCWPINGAASTTVMMPFPCVECVLVELVHFPIN